MELNISAKKFQQHISACGIRHESSVKYTPEQNGVAEAAGKIIFQKVRCLLLAANLPQSYWGFAADTAVYLKNRTPTVALSNKDVPESVWSGKPVDLAHLRVFGCIAYEKKDQYRKLDSRASKFIFVGYSDTQKQGYRLLDPSHPNKPFHVGRNIIFMENTFHHRPTESTADRSTAETERVDMPIDAEPRVTRSRGRYASTATVQPTPPTNGNATAPDSSSESLEQSLCDEGSACSSREESPYSSRDHTPYPSRDVSPSREDSSPFADDNKVINVSEYQPEEHSSDSEAADSSPVVTRNTGINSLITEGVIYTAIASDDEPQTVNEALKRRDAMKWREAMTNELKSMAKNEVWELVQKPQHVKPVSCRWVYKIKHRADGSIERYKARLVARRFSQFCPADETYSPVMRQSTLKMLLALAVEHEMDISHCDVMCAFLHGNLESPVYMDQPPGHDDGTGRVCLLKKALYGLRNSGRLWYKRFTEHLEQLDFVQSLVDPCVFTLHKGNSIIIIGLWVDDLLILSNDPKLEKLVKTEISSAFEMRDLGQAKELLGLCIQRDREGSLQLSQCHYISSVLEKYGMSDCNPVRIPMEAGLQIEPNSGAKTKEPYRELIGSLIWISTCTRPEIAFAVNKLAAFSNNPSDEHFKILKKILKYLKGTLALKLTFKRTNSEVILAYADADWAGDATSRKSTTGFAIKLAGAVISWESRKQRSVALSTCEAEYVAISEAAKDVTFLVSLYESITKMKAPIPVIYNDNQAAQKLAANPMTTKKSKHIDIKYHYIRECIQNRMFDLQDLPTKEMVADILTKALPAPAHQQFTADLGLQ